MAQPDQVEQRIQFCRASDGVRLAYAAVGNGRPLIKVPSWLHLLEYDWRSLRWRPILDVLSARHTLVRYDARGTGLSDWDVNDISFESYVDDLIAVAEATGVTRFPLIGFAQGCAVSVAYAVRFPERVERLILYGGYPRGWKRRGDAANFALWQALVTLIRHGWGQNNSAFRQVFTSLFMPHATPEQIQGFVHLQRASASPENAVRMAEALGDIDVSALLPQVRTPTLVIHARRDPISPYAEGRALATGIPGARFLTLDSTNHMPLPHEPAWPVLAQSIREFLAPTE